MFKRKEKAFTLIELIATLVIMAIIALIVTPLVMNIIRSARTASDKRSIDAYGRSIELAIAGYLLDTGKFPQQISDLTVEYSGNEVVCSTTQINTDSSVYLAGCKVNNRDVIDYIYGKEEVINTTYKVGDMVTYNNINYYVIKNPSTFEEELTLLKAEPLSYSELQTYSSGTGIHIINYGAEENIGGMHYNESSNNLYSSSNIKIIVDAWKAAEAVEATEARLIQFDEIIDNFGYEWGMINPSTEGWVPSSLTPSWIYNSNYFYWTMTPYNESYYAWSVDLGGALRENQINGAAYGCFDSFSCGYGAVRPVIVLPKSALSS